MKNSTHSCTGSLRTAEWTLTEIAERQPL